MDNNKKLLRDIYQNAAMGLSTLKRMIKRCEDENFRKAMADQFAEYHEIHVKAQELMSAHGLQPQAKSPVEGLAFPALYLNLKVDKTSSHMAEMIMQGSLMGIIDIARAIRENPAAEDEVRILAKKLLATEERNLRNMQEYL